MNWITSALAEAEQATETAAANGGINILGQKVDFFDIILLALAAYNIITGLMTVFTGKFYGGIEKSYTKYDPAELKPRMPLIGLSYAMIGVSLVIMILTMSHVLSSPLGWILFGVAVVVTCALSALAVKGLQKKPKEKK